MVKQNAVFLQIYIRPDDIESVTDILNTGKNPSVSNTFFSFENLPDVHFARWLIAPKTDKFRGSLLYSANIDGSVENHLKELAEKKADELDQLLQHCDNYPEISSITTNQRLEYLKKHSQKTPAFYVGAPQRSVQQIQQEAKLHLAVKDFVQKNGKQWKNSRDAYSAIQQFLKDDPKWDWAKSNANEPKKQGFKMILLILGLILLLPILLVVILLIHLFYEIPSKPFGKSINEVPIDRLKPLKDQEDIIYQNQLSQVFETKGGLRRLLLRLLLWATNFAAANWFVEGTLMGTPTIHFARWVFIDGGKRFVFFSNFDGSYDGYLGDFVDNNGWGLNAIYGAAKGYPRTLFVFGKGSYHLIEFLGWGRLTQVPTPIWYSAYPWYGLQQIVSKTKLRAGLFPQTEPDQQHIEETLRRI